MGSCSSQSVQKSRKGRKVMSGVHTWARGLREGPRDLLAEWTARLSRTEVATSRSCTALVEKLSVTWIVYMGDYRICL